MLKEFCLISTFSVPPTLAKPLKDVSIFCGKPLRLEIVVQGIPLPTVSWYKDENLLTGPDSIIESKDKSHSLSLKESNTNHNGIYKAFVENSAGFVESICNVEIQTKPQIVPPSDVKITAGEDFNIAVIIDGKPKPKIKWLKDKKEIPSNLGLIAGEDGNSFSLNLKESTTLLNGSYSITATNPAGTDSASFKVVVSGM